MKKMTSKNYEDQVWCDVEYGEEIWYSKYFEYCDVAHHAKRFGVQVLPSETPNTVKVVAMTRRSNIKTRYTFNPF
ncbi:MAG: hypothetical protein ACKPCI_05810 [Dolichospermum sp.]